MGTPAPTDDALATSVLPDEERSAFPAESKIAKDSSSDDEHQPLIDGDSKPEPTSQTLGDNFPPKQSTVESSATLATKALEFAANASPGTLAGIAIGFSAVTYFVLGRVGLLLVGAFGGVLGFVSWEARNPEVARAVRGEKGVDVLERLGLDIAKIKENIKDEDVEPEDEEQYSLKALDEFRPETREALGNLIDAVIRDYVKWWYSPIIPTDHSFPLACRKTFTSYLLAISNHLYRKRPADAFLDMLTNSSSIIIVFMSELASAFSELGPDSSMTAVDAVYTYLATNPNCHLANLLNQNQQATKFKMVAEDLLGFLERKSYNCDPAKVFLREILASSVLETTLQRCSKPEWINGWIVYLLEAGEPNLNQAIDVGMQTGRDTANNVFADMDGNVGNVGIAKLGRSSTDIDRGRRKETSSHKKKLSKAEEELDEAMEEMKRMNAMIARDDRRRQRASTVLKDTERPEVSTAEVEDPKKVATPGETSPQSSVPGNIVTSTPQTSTDGASSKGEAVPPLTPQSGNETSSPNSSPRRSGGAQFTSFDQIAPPARMNVSDEEEAVKRVPLTLHNASFTLHDDGTGDKNKIRNKPNWDYLIQVEPSSPDHSGWMIVRRYSDFETLHEILRRIAQISGATAFTELHKELPGWKIHTRESLRGELERYLRDACWYQSLAESEGMKRFLEKSQGHTHGDSKTFAWETVGKNMLDVLTIAPKGAMEGGKTLVGGVSGVFNNFNNFNNFPGLSRKTTSQSIDLTPNSNSNRLSISTPPRMENSRSPARSERASLDSQQSSVISTQPGKMAPMERRTSYQSQAGDGDDYFRAGRSDRMDSMSGPASGRPSREHSRASSLAPLRSPSAVSLDNMKLPPHPDEMPDDYEVPGSAGSFSRNIDGVPAALSPVNPTSPAPLSATKKTEPKPARQYSQMSEQETRVAVELIFAVINEMYTLSSAWNIRRTLLTAAKSFLLRPGNPSLLTVQSLIQTSLLDGNTSDAGIAAQLRKLRENTMPTEQELAAWPAEMTAEEKEKLRVRARHLLIRSGVPAALMGVMGQAATSEALGRVFDCLQIEEVARGLIFGLMLQAVRVITH